MTGTRISPITALLIAALLTACGEGATTGEGGHQHTEGVAIQGAEIDALIAVAPVDTSVGETNANAEAAKAAEPMPVQSLPLKRGFYVASDTPCNQASNATLLLITREGINGSSEVCTFGKIEKVGATTYRATRFCSSGGEAWGQPEESDTATVTYEIANDTSFTSRSENGWESSARYCAQQSLPDPWRDNDISDLIR